MGRNRTLDKNLIQINFLTNLSDCCVPYESSSLIITSNQPFSQCDQIFPDTMMTVAAIDRIIHHATIIEIEGESYQKKQSIKN
jgi:hypothetical protein